MQGIEALVLVAPAVMAFSFLKPANAGKSGQASLEGSGVAVSFSGAAADPSPVANTKR